MPEKKRVCIIGAGPSGMSTLYHFKKLKDEGKTSLNLFAMKSNLTGVVCGTTLGEQVCHMSAQADKPMTFLTY